MGPLNYANNISRQTREIGDGEPEQHPAKQELALPLPSAEMPIPARFARAKLPHEKRGGVFRYQVAVKQP